jgi:hypothetical protein
MSRSLLLRLVLACALAAGVLAPATASAVEPGVVTGIRPNGATIDDIAKTKESGARWVRVFVGWHSIEKADNSYDGFQFDALRKTIDRHVANGLNVLVIVHQTPSWASGTSNTATPPRDPATYADFLKFLATNFKGKVKAWELWNEPNDDAYPGEFWEGPPNPAAYTALLKATYPVIKAVDPSAIVVTGGLVANDFQFVEGIIAAGGRDYFDAVGVHTDTACLTSPPDEFYREPDGRIGRYSFTGYREIHAITGKPIWMTELGWSTTPAGCQRGMRAGTKPGGVSEALQAAYLTAGFQCLHSDPYVAVAMWFSLQDVSTSEIDDHRLGLLRDNGSAKPSFNAFRAFAAAPSAKRCGPEVDHVAPVVQMTAPREGQQFHDSLYVEGSATDSGTGVRRMQLWVDGKKVGTSQNGGRFRFEWRMAKNLSLGKHRVELRAFDHGRNVGIAGVTVVKDAPGKIRVGTAKLDFRVKKGVKRGTVQLYGKVSVGPDEVVKPRGRVHIFFEYRKGGRWVQYSHYNKSIKSAFRFTAPLRKRGTWRIHARFVAEKPYAPVKTKYFATRY